MPGYSQDGRPLLVKTPLGKDKLLLRGFSGSEGLSQLFRFELDMLAEKQEEVSFDKLLGKKLTIEVALPNKQKRFFNGVCSRVGQGGRVLIGDKETLLTRYRAEIVPQFWLLTRKAQSRIFQHLAVPDILKKVLAGLDVAYDLQGVFHQRDFCVQYRETDFNFASRLMEEEGIYYFFKHSDGSHQMFVANTPGCHPDLPTASKLTYDEHRGGTRPEDRVYEWDKVQELRSGKYTLWDHSFELPHKHLEAEKTIADSVAAGKVTHKLKLSENSELEIYDWPGEYAQRFDGVDKGGGDRPADLQKIFEDNKRTVEIRMQEEAVPSVVIQGISNCRQLVSGHKFTLERHFNADGQYVITGVSHSARGSGEFRTGHTGEFTYQNSFTCIPMALPFRPPRTTPKPVVQGTQTAVVVGPAGEEIFTDKYSRVKVQFHWDRQGKNDPDSSCWVRVGTPWAGKQWGVIHIPRIGQEVVVDFLEGDPDQPIIVGSVYNAEMMPPYQLPGNKTQSGVKSRSTLGGSPSNFNEFRFEDKKGSEQVYFHAERNLDSVVEADETRDVGHDRTTTIGHDDKTTVKNDKKLDVLNNRDTMIAVDDTETVGNNQSITVANNQDTTVGVEQTTTVGATREVKVGAQQKHIIGATEEVTIGASRDVKIGGVDQLKIGGARTTMIAAADSLTVGAALSITCGAAATITAGGATTVTSGGVITITSGGAITVTSGGAVAITASVITLTAGAILCAGPVIAPTVITASVVSPVYTPGAGNML